MFSKYMAVYGAVFGAKRAPSKMEKIKRLPLRRCFGIGKK